MAGNSDSELVEAILAGETEPFGVLVRRYQDRVYGVAVGVLSDFDLAFDVAQEAFLCAYCDLPKLKDPSRFGAWLCGIARNTAFELLRERQRQQLLAARLVLSGTTETAPSAQQIAEANEERLAVHLALGRVKATDREALTLCYADGVSQKDICGFLNISAGTLKGRLQRGRAALREELSMVEEAYKDHAPDDTFAGRLEETIRVFGAKGPATHHIPSAWLDALKDQTGRILAAGDDGMRIDIALSHSGSASQRYHAVTHFGIRRDARSLELLQRMLDDRAPRVRRQAVCWFASRIHASRRDKGGFRGPFDARRAVGQIVPELEHLIARLADENFNVRLTAVHTVGAYRDTGDARVLEALHAALKDPKHKVRHAAARFLKVPCPGCGRKW